MNNQNFEVKISIKDLLRIFISKIWLILLAAIIAGGSLYVYSGYKFSPVYKSVARIYILRQNIDNNETASGYAQNLNAALTTVNDCKLIIKTETTMQRVKEKIETNRSASSLLSSVTLSSSDDSRIILITAKASDPESAKQLADTVATEGVLRIKEVMGYDQASIMEYGLLPSSPSNSVFSAKIPAVALIAAALVYILYIIKFLTNDKISEPDEVTDYLGLTVLGVIPNEDEASGKKKYRGYGAYYKHKKYGNPYGQDSEAQGGEHNTAKATAEISKKAAVNNTGNKSGKGEAK